MLEADAKNLDPALFLDGISFGLEGCAKISQQIHAEKIRKGLEKRSVALEGEIMAKAVTDVALLCDQVCSLSLKKCLISNNYIHSLE